MFDQIKNLYSLQKKAKEIQAKLARMHIEAEEGPVSVTFNGKQECVEVVIKEEGLTDAKKLAELLKKANNKALKKSQEIAAAEMKDVMGDMGGLGNLLGGGNK